MFNKGDATGATSGTRTAYNSREPEFILVFLWLMLLNLLFSVCFFVVDVAQSFVQLFLIVIYDLFSFQQSLSFLLLAH
jgi:hypothetical protein